MFTSAFIQSSSYRRTAESELQLELLHHRWLICPQAPSLVAPGWAARLVGGENRLRKRTLLVTDRNQSKQGTTREQSPWEGTGRNHTSPTYCWLNLGCCGRIIIILLFESSTDSIYIEWILSSWEQKPLLLPTRQPQKVRRWWPSMTLTWSLSI